MANQNGLAVVLDYSKILEGCIGGGRSEREQEAGDGGTRRKKKHLP